MVCAENIRNENNEGRNVRKQMDTDAQAYVKTRIRCSNACSTGGPGVCSKHAMHEQCANTCAPEDCVYRALGKAVAEADPLDVQKVMYSKGKCTDNVLKEHAKHSFLNDLKTVKCIAIIICIGVFAHLLIMAFHALTSLQ